MRSVILLAFDQAWFPGPACRRPASPATRDGAFVGAHRRVERGVAGEAPVHRDDVVLGTRRGVVAICLIWSGCRSPSSSAAIWPLILRRLKNSRFCAAVVPIFTRLHERRTYSWIDGADPPHGVGREAEALVGLEALDRVHEADIALRDHLGNGQAIAAIAHGDLGHEPQMGGDELLGRAGIADAPCSAWRA